MNIKDMSVEEVKEALTISDGHCKYKRDNRARESLNKLLGSKFLAVFREERVYSQQWVSGKVDWSGETVYVLTEKMKLVRMFNSEWAFFSEQELKK